MGSRLSLFSRRRPRRTLVGDVCLCLRLLSGRRPRRTRLGLGCPLLLLCSGRRVRRMRLGLARPLPLFMCAGSRLRQMRLGLDLPLQLLHSGFHYRLNEAGFGWPEASAAPPLCCFLTPLLGSARVLVATSCASPVWARHKKTKNEDKMGKQENVDER